MMMRLLASVLLVLSPVAATAQALSCHADMTTAPPHLDEDMARDGGRRVVPTTGYTLSLMWAPEYCRTRGQSARDAAECGAGQRFGFVLHGLWPEGHGDQWPQYCRAVGLLPQAIIRQNLCMTPSAQLLQHEWTKHGACVTNDPAAYFAEERRLFGAIHFPDMDALSRSQAGPGAVARSFAAANPGWPASAVQVVANRRGWLSEVRICLNRTKRPQPCPADRRVEPSAGPLRIWRSGPDRASQSGARYDRSRYEDRVYTRDRYASSGFRRRYDRAGDE